MAVAESIPEFLGIVLAIMNDMKRNGGTKMTKRTQTPGQQPPSSSSAASSREMKVRSLMEIYEDLDNQE
ncbi:hypothetical protein Nepgr_025810 [Nepenthes gracilis]|uniref:Uncharacterized protein n=1 Tax=Nepenthes gracilis TaxID=150966 RepID=A0AAD3XZU6_NEPGR|nr:hypothetical protein Nepgr_025810 [Nepenthes gracilis]